MLGVMPLTGRLCTLPGELFANLCGVIVLSVSASEAPPPPLVLPTRELFFFLCFFLGSTASISTLLLISLARLLSSPRFECECDEPGASEWRLCERREDEEPIWLTESLGTMVSRSSLSLAEISFSEEDGYGSGTTLRPRTEDRALDARDVREDGLLGVSPSDSRIRPKLECCGVRLVDGERARSLLRDDRLEEAELCLLVLVELFAFDTEE